MLSYKEIKIAVNTLLKEKTGLKIYGNDVTEGYETPSLFVQIISKPHKRQTRNFAKSGFSVKITYFQNEPDESEQLELLDIVREAFGMVLVVQDRRLTTGEITYDYVGQKENILQITVDYDFCENTSTPSTEEIAEAVDINLIKKETEE